MKPILALALAVPFIGAVTVVSSPPESSAEIATAAEAFLDALTDEQRSKAVFDFTDEQRKDWHYVPRDNEGLIFKEMTDDQRKLAHELLQSTLSTAGYHKTTTIMFLDQVLYWLSETRGRPQAIRDPNRYWIAVFGSPSTNSDWGWRVQGHHVSLNFTSKRNEITIGSPNFFGANPHEVQSGPYAGLRALGAEEDLGRGLLMALDAEQQKQAIISDEVPGDIILNPGREADLLGEPKGLAMSAMNADQKDALRLLVEEYAHNVRRDLARSRIERIRAAGEDKIHFAWIGSTERGEGHYYRVHGPTFVIEYDNASGNHSHTVWRDLEKDFGEDLLLEHYQEHPLPHDHR